MSRTRDEHVTGTQKPLLMKSLVGGAPRWLSRLGPGIATAEAWVAVVVRVPSLAPEPPHAVGVAKRKKRKITVTSEGV